MPDTAVYVQKAVERSAMIHDILAGSSLYPLLVFFMSKNEKFQTFETCFRPSSAFSNRSLFAKCVLFLTGAREAL